LTDNTKIKLPSKGNMPINMKELHSSYSLGVD